MAQKRRLVLTGGKGAHSKAKIATAGAFKGKIVKKVDGTITAEQAKKRRDKSMRFQTALSEAGIPVIPAEAKIVGHGNECRLYFVQKHVPSKQIMASAFERANESECVRLTKELLSHAEKVNAYSRKSGNQLVMDINFHNWVLRGNSLACIDFYPGRIKSKKSLEIFGLENTTSKIVKAGRIALYPLQERKRRDPTLRIRAIIDRAIQFRPEFTEQFLALGKEHAKRHYSRQRLKKLLKALEKPENLKMGPSVLGRIAMKLEKRKGRN